MKNFKFLNKNQNKVIAVITRYNLNFRTYVKLERERRGIHDSLPPARRTSPHTIGDDIFHWIEKPEDMQGIHFTHYQTTHIRRDHLWWIIRGKDMKEYLINTYNTQPYEDL